MYITAQATDIINAIAQFGMMVFIGLGVWVAYKQLEASRVEKGILRKSEIAEEAIASAFSVEDALKNIRNPFDSIPMEEVENKRYPYAKRYERIVEANDLFAALRQSQIRVRAVIGDQKVDEAIQALFSARNDVDVAIQVLADYSDEPPISRVDREHQVKLRRSMYGVGDDRDELGKSIRDAVETIEARLSPVARLEKSR